MKPLKLELQAFGPFVERQTVNFEKLSGKGIFLIKGDTGSGKTTIFDAMTFALYGGSSGESEKSRTGRNDFEQWRCTQADDSMETFVSFTFSINDRKFVFTRKLVPKRINLSTQYEAGEIDEFGNIIPFFNNPKKDDLTRKAEELVGLTKEQFRQVVLLPQGQFERFLTASSSEKEEILEKIFGADRWSAYVQAFYDEADRHRRLLDEEKNTIHISLREENVEDVDELAGIIDALKKELKATEENHAAFDSAARQEMLNRDRDLSKKFEHLHSIEKTIRDLDSQKNLYETKETQYNNALTAESFRGLIGSFETAQNQLESKEEMLKLLRAKLPDIEKIESEAKAAKEEHEKSSPIEENNKKIGAYEAKRDAYGNLDSLKNTFDEAAKKCAAEEKAFSDAEELLSGAVKRAASAKNDFDAADKTAKEYRDRYFSGIYGEIAATLAEDGECPVCGSRVHPKPAARLPESVSREECESKQADADGKKALWGKAEKSRTEAESERNNKKNSFDTARIEKETASGKLETAKQNLIEGIPDLGALLNEISRLQNANSDYNSRADELNKKYDAAVSKTKNLKAEINSAEAGTAAAQQEFITADGKLKSALSAKGLDDYLALKASLLDPDELSKIQKEVVEYKTTCKNSSDELEKSREDLKEFAEPDSGKFDERQNEINAELAGYSGKTEKIRNDIKRLEEKYTDLAKKKEHFCSEIHQAETDMAFARKLRGDSGIGLKRYVLAIMFSQVIDEANRMLEKVHGGRYHLFRSDERGNGNKRGLELMVHDNNKPEHKGRGVGMLSGGEKFLVSLALSIGMSTVAQKSGVQIEALFIDEGFGTLDDKSILDAMDVLDSVRKGNGMIGIISHVQVLEANIPTHLEVIKSGQGSSIKLS